MISNRFNAEAKEKIEDLVTILGFQNPSCDVIPYVYDMQGTQAIELSEDGNTRNLILLFPIPSGIPGAGKIQSAAIYGSSLMTAYQNLKSRGSFFGIPISDISLESGNEKYIDIYLDY